VTSLWYVIILALHLGFPAGHQRESFDLRAIVNNQPVLEARVSRDGAGRFLLRTPAEFLPVVIEQSRIHSQVYTIFAPWQPALDSFFTIDGTENDETTTLQPLTPIPMDELPSFQFASGAFPPLTVDVTPVLLQQGLTREGRYTVQWPRVGDSFGVGNSMSDSGVDSTQNLDINLIIGSRDVSIFAPGQGIIVQVTYP